MPDFEIPQDMPVQDIDTTRLNSLLLASTLMQTMRARAEEAQQEDNAFKALEAVATTSSENYRDDGTYQKYRNAHADVTEREREFLKTLVHFQTLGLQIFERNQTRIKNLEDQVKGHAELNKALEASLVNQTALQHRVHEFERQLQQEREEHQRETQAREDD